MVLPESLRVLAWLLLAGLLLPAPLRADDSRVLAVIVPPGFVSKSPGAVDLELIFLRKRLYWPSGKRIRPANLPPQHALRQQFSQQILGSLPEGQTEYWNEQYFHGISPPHVVASQEAMLRFVADTPGAIGYVDACLADARVRVVVWIERDGTLRYTAPACR